MSRNMQRQPDEDTRKIITWMQPPVGDEPVTVVISEIGNTPHYVAEMLHETLNVTITDLDALDDAMPLIVYEKLDRREAEKVRWRFQLVGASIQLGKPREPKGGYAQVLFGRRPVRHI